ncbi:hypothetical protein AMAG_16876 [Allomyces macrogynus ATCC 38327]|uniref:C3H1-type domain-containing protein n=1 Tax=Allomyces macrogynus (strain ATCC 38327) TaxID=578462 RepID=A0A0L0TCZ0_ALLM3|nr:hypothetical protein AMAG_16876 [Allomyces macrogynus ATCC 38327]|eukprot:KNE72394.1 hypothetical protein AMAG_16876 [Allomyces macrogynus ATCC 38327]
MSGGRKVCQYFLKGNCRFGANCKNLHPSPQSSSQGYNASPFGYQSYRGSGSSSSSQHHGGGGSNQYHGGGGGNQYHGGGGGRGGGRSGGRDGHGSGGRGGGYANGRGGGYVDDNGVPDRNSRDVRELADMIRSDFTTDKPQWPLSSYGPDSSPCILAGLVPPRTRTPKVRDHPVEAAQLAIVKTNSAIRECDPNPPRGRTRRSHFRD